MAATSAQQLPPQPQPPTGGGDPFDTLLTLEDQFYTEGYDEGTADGVVAGRTEGRQLGLERGFQKFVEAGRLQGRAVVWANRLRLGHASSPSPSSSGAASLGSKAPATVGGSESPAGGEKGEGKRVSGGEDGEAVEAAELSLPPLPENPRLGKHITTLYALVETESLSTENNDEAVDDFDDRLRRAQGRFKVIERTVGEGDNGKPKGGDGHGHDPGAKAGKGEGVVDV